MTSIRHRRMKIKKCSCQSELRISSKNLRLWTDSVKADPGDRIKNKFGKILRVQKFKYMRQILTSIGNEKNVPNEWVTNLEMAFILTWNLKIQFRLL